MTRVGIIGMGGFAGSHHGAVKSLEAAGACRLVCTCDPAMAEFEEKKEKLSFAAREVRCYDNYHAMLDACADELDVVTIPTPIPLHARMHNDCVARGLAVYVEKPPTLDIIELKSMLEAERNASKLTNVGFNFITEQPRQTLKQRMLAGEFGAVQEVRYRGLTPRSTGYFSRSGWAGRLMIEQQVVLDSCIGNAMAHNIHNVLFWCGQDGLLSWGEVTDVSAECYRAHRIQGMDTVFLQAETGAGQRIRIAASHACAGSEMRGEEVRCENATVSYVTRGTWCVQHADGRREEGPTDAQGLLQRNLGLYFGYVRGDAERPINRLVDTVPFVELSGLVYLAAGQIRTVPDEHLDKSGEDTRRGGHFVRIRGLEQIATRFLEAGEFPSAQGVAWAAPGGRAARSELGRLHEVVRGLVAGG